MPKLNIVIISLSLFILAGCNAMNSFSKALEYKGVYTELFIPAEPEEIWAVITDAENYNQWNPVIIKAEGSYELGAKITNHVLENDEKEVVIKSKVMIYEPPFHLNQFGGYQGIITFDHHYILDKVDGGTKLIQREDYTGFYVHFWDAGWVEPAYSRVNLALRDEVIKRRTQK